MCNDSSCAALSFPNKFCDSNVALCKVKAQDVLVGSDFGRKKGPR